MVPEMLVIFEQLTRLTAQDILLTLTSITTLDLTFIIKQNFITIAADSLHTISG
jgi:hypothetical protein